MVSYALVVMIGPNKGLNKQVISSL